MMSQKRAKTWQASTRPRSVGDAEKQVIIRACDALIRDALKLRFLPQVTPTAVNDPVDIRGAWQGGRYRFMQRYRSGWADNRGEEFDTAFARLDRMGPDQFDIFWMRHTGTWWRLHAGVTLARALHLLETDGILRPP